MVLYMAFFQMVARQLTELENYKTEREFHDEYVLKVPPPACFPVAWRIFLQVFLKLECDIEVIGHLYYSPGIFSGSPSF